MKKVKLTNHVLLFLYLFLILKYDRLIDLIHSLQLKTYNTSGYSVVSGFNSRHKSWVYNAVYYWPACVSFWSPWGSWVFALEDIRRDIKCLAIKLCPSLLKIKSKLWFDSVWCKNWVIRIKGIGKICQKLLTHYY